MLLVKSGNFISVPSYICMLYSPYDTLIREMKKIPQASWFNFVRLTNVSCVYSGRSRDAYSTEMPSVSTFRYTYMAFFNQLIPLFLSSHSVLWSKSGPWLGSLVKSTEAGVR